ncbi:hypothetical protein J1614_006680 [Plenodomus biglobosus]|nr:hypothetical protein J1614_006680 [Plenodomus biglobosus]
MSNTLVHVWALSRYASWDLFASRRDFAMARHLDSENSRWSAHGRLGGNSEGDVDRGRAWATSCVAPPESKSTTVGSKSEKLGRVE